MSNKLIYCTECQEEHVVNATKDAKGIIVGYFCPHSKRMVDATTTKWNGEDIYEPMRTFLRKNASLPGVARTSPSGINGLSRKMAYMFLQLSENKSKNINYHFAAYHMKFVATRLRSELRAKGIGVSFK